jgi:hypothetical protein
VSICELGQHGQGLLAAARSVDECREFADASVFEEP